MCSICIEGSTFLVQKGYRYAQMDIAGKQRSKYLLNVWYFWERIRFTPFSTLHSLNNNLQFLRVMNFLTLLSGEGVGGEMCILFCF